MPTLVNNPTISINTPTGQRNIDNPLYTYTFHPQPSASDFPRSDGSVRQSRQIRNPGTDSL